QNQEIINEILNTNKMELLYKGRFLSLFKLKETAPLVTVYDSPLPVIKTKRPHSLLLNMGRFDALRHAGVIFDSDWVKASDSDGKILDPIDLLNFMTKEWYADKRAKDLGWDSRDSKLPNRYLNGFFFAWKRNFDIDYALDHDLTYLLSERSYSPELLVSNMQKEGSESGAVLTRYSSGIAPISISGRGYKVLLEDKELPLNATSDIEFKEKDFRGRKGTFVVLRFVPIPGEKYQDVDIVTSDAEVFPGFPGGSTFHPMQPSMAACDAQLRREFNKLILDTKCPNKPHLIKYSYYPKWRADVPISMGPNGFMVLTPKTERTEILHRWRNIDIVACIITCVGLLMVFVLILKPRVY
ncbi:MAG: hypothetical protein GYA55_09980, partial [SAR324 cluster bacterium]|nr:hypothetical protein [SAR324 cluster bacterium]